MSTVSFSVRYFASGECQNTFILILSFFELKSMHQSRIRVTRDSFHFINLQQQTASQQQNTTSLQGLDLVRQALHSTDQQNPQVQGDLRGRRAKYDPFVLSPDQIAWAHFGAFHRASFGQ
jgi:hypothetical protein